MTSPFPQKTSSGFFKVLEDSVYCHLHWSKDGGCKDIRLKVRSWSCQTNSCPIFIQSRERHPRRERFGQCHQEETLRDESHAEGRRWAPRYQSFSHERLGSWQDGTLLPTVSQPLQKTQHSSCSSPRCIKMVLCHYITTTFFVATLSMRIM